MARVLNGIEKGIRLHGENSDTSNVDILFGTTSPGGDAGDQDAAALGSLYIRQNGGSSAIYQKIDTTNTASDWIINGEPKIPQYTEDPISPQAEDTWVRKTALLSHTLLQIGLTTPTNKYELRYRTQENVTVGVILT